MNIEISPIVYGDHTIDVNALPPVSVEALIKRGLTHFLGNEQASKVTAKIRTHIATSLSTPDKEVNQVDVSKEMISSFRSDNADLVAEWTAAVVASAVSALRDGTVGIRAVGEPKAAPRDAMIRNLAKAEVMNTLISASMLKVGTKAVKPATEFITGKGTESETVTTFETFVDRRVAKHAERLGAEADKEIARLAREAAKALAKVTDGDMADLLG